MGPFSSLTTWGRKPPSQEDRLSALELRGEITFSASIASTEDYGIDVPVKGVQPGDIVTGYTIINDLMNLRMRATVKSPGVVEVIITNQTVSPVVLTNRILRVSARRWL